MAIPITIDKLLNENIVEWARIEFKEGWNPKTTLKTISAFANDIDNWGGGYIVIGAEEKDGKVVRPGDLISPVETMDEQLSLLSEEQKDIAYEKFIEMEDNNEITSILNHQVVFTLLFWIEGMAIYTNL